MKICSPRYLVRNLFRSPPPAAPAAKPAGVCRAPVARPAVLTGARLAWLARPARRLGILRK